MPLELSLPLTYLITGKLDPAAKVVAAKVETRRAEISSRGNKEIEIWYSPKPGSAVGDGDAESRRPKPGKVLKLTRERIAATGKDKRWGTFLHLLARSFESNVVFELGSCAGISASYLALAPTVRTLITVEGSEALARIAAESLAQIGPHARVINRLFDEAIDSELPALDERIDFAYIDGHHEKVATIHYLDRLLPYLADGAVVVFDDISWSHDMREAWDILRRRNEFAHAVDLGVVGVCILHSGSKTLASPQNWDLRSVVGHPTIGDPWGWKE